MKTFVSRNEYFDLCRKAAEERKFNMLNEYDIKPLDFTAYPKLSETTRKIVDANFLKETTDKHGDYLLTGHWFDNLSYEFAEKCGMELTIVDTYSAYAFSDDQLAIFSYTEGDIFFSPYKDKKTYEKRKKEQIRYYEYV